ncbi:hypothetical protein [Streptobacillus felis]|uniref:hypothetical protein n=1 Tax=Streptobacillus felis TaxID=1384509 RepID=UPI000AA97300|nr:hypothetical protein [Streptobacillus felis]
MERNIISKFEAEINGVKFNDEELYNSVEFILEQIEDKFGEVYNNDFVAALESTINNMYLKYENFSYGELENEFYYCISEAKEFNNLEFKYYGSDWKIETLNEGIIAGDYFEKDIEKVFKKQVINPICQKLNKSVNLFEYKGKNLIEKYTEWNIDEYLKDNIISRIKENKDLLELYNNKNIEELIDRINDEFVYDNLNEMEYDLIKGMFYEKINNLNEKVNDNIFDKYLDEIYKYVDEIKEAANVSISYNNRDMEDYFNKYIKNNDLINLYNISFQENEMENSIFLETDDVKIELSGIFNIDEVKNKIENIKFDKEFQQYPDYEQVVIIAKNISKDINVEKCMFEVSEDYLYDLGLESTFKEALKIKSKNYEVFSENPEAENLVYSENELTLIRDGNSIQYLKTGGKWGKKQSLNANDELFEDLKEIGTNILEELNTKWKKVDNKNIDWER